MKIIYPDLWPQTPEEAIRLQNQLKTKVITSDQIGEIQHVAGVDVGFEEGGTITRAAVVILRFPDLQMVEHAIARISTGFSYIPGLLSFREIPALLQALEKISIIPDLILCDGQGIAHPRRFGIASHLGVLIDIPTIGVGKSLLVGKYEEPSAERGSWQPLRHYNETIGAVLRTRTGFNPLYISIGHRISLPTAIEYVLRCTTRYRLPETTRMAHHLASNVRD